MPPWVGQSIDISGTLIILMIVSAVIDRRKVEVDRASMVISFPFFSLRSSVCEAAADHTSTLLLFSRQSSACEAAADHTSTLFIVGLACLVGRCVRSILMWMRAWVVFFPVNE